MSARLEELSHKLGDLLIFPLEMIEGGHQNYPAGSSIPEEIQAQLMGFDQGDIEKAVAGQFFISREKGASVTLTQSKCRRFTYIELGAPQV